MHVQAKCTKQTPQYHHDAKMSLRLPKAKIKQRT